VTETEIKRDRDVIEAAADVWQCDEHACVELKSGGRHQDEVAFMFQADAEFAAQARTRWPAALDALEEQKRLVKSWKEIFRRLDGNDYAEHLELLRVELDHQHGCVRHYMERSDRLANVGRVMRTRIADVADNLLGLQEVVESIELLDRVEAGGLQMRLGRDQLKAENERLAEEVAEFGSMAYLRVARLAEAWKEAALNHGVARTVAIEAARKLEQEGAQRCGHCKKSKTPEGHDGCLGTLPGDVMNACCGHGEKVGAYIQYGTEGENGRWTETGRIADEEALAEFEGLGVGPEPAQKSAESILSLSAEGSCCGHCFGGLAESDAVEVWYCRECLAKIEQEGKEL
jgi:ribosomal protein L37AE/L43A